VCVLSLSGEDRGFLRTPPAGGELGPSEKELPRSRGNGSSGRPRTLGADSGSTHKVGDTPSGAANGSGGLPISPFAFFGAVGRVISPHPSIKFLARRWRLPRVRGPLHGPKGQYTDGFCRGNDPVDRGGRVCIHFWSHPPRSVVAHQPLNEAL
jgi:hypothetical protein